MKLSQVWKQPRLQDFLTQTKIRACLIPNLDYEKKETKTKTQHVQNKNPIWIYYKEEIKQGYDKKTYPKLMLNILKTKKNSTFIST